MSLGPFRAALAFGDQLILGRELLGRVGHAAGTGGRVLRELNLTWRISHIMESLKSDIGDHGKFSPTLPLFSDHVAAVEDSQNIWWGSPTVQNFQHSADHAACVPTVQVSS